MGGGNPNLGGGSPAPMSMMGAGNMPMGFDPRMSMMGMPGIGYGHGHGHADGRADEYADDGRQRIRPSLLHGPRTVR